MRKIDQIPKTYEGREQALVKHELLKNYLEKLFLIIGTGARRVEDVELCYVDGFAGPWGGNPETLEGTSIAISLETLDRCRSKLAELGISAKVRALYVERDAQAFARLSSYLQSAVPEGLSADCLHGDFVDLRGEILRWCGPNAFTFFFIDPKGWKPVGIDVLKPLLQRPRSEFLINFIYDFINRTASMADYQEDMAEFLGESVDLAGKTPTERESSLLGAYRRNLRLRAPTAKPPYRARTAYVRVMDPSRERTKYHLVYLTFHPMGVIKFMEISQDVSLVQQQVRAKKRTDAREKRSGTQDMFSDLPTQEHEETEVEPSTVDKFWLTYFASGIRQIGKPEFADILEQMDWMPRDLQASMVRLVKAGRLLNLDANAASRYKRPVHYEANERWQLAQPGSAASHAA